MNEKLSFQQLVDSLSVKADVSKKVAETFSKAFFDTIVDALYMGESVIRVKGLGTFKLVEVDSRESVNVSNGERIVIPGYKKVSFTPDDSVVDALNNRNVLEEEKEDETVEEVKTEEIVEDENTDETVEVLKTIEICDNEHLTDNVTEEVTIVDEVEEELIATETSNSVADIIPVVTAEDNEVTEELFEVSEPKVVEMPSDALSGIDMLISTPESIDDVRNQYLEAKHKADEAIEVAKKANSEKLRLERLLERLEANAEPEMKSAVSSEVNMPLEDTKELTGGDSSSIKNVVPLNDENVSSDEQGESCNNKDSLADETKSNNEALSRLLTNEGEGEDAEMHNSHSLLWTFGTLIVISVIACVAYFLYKTSESIESVEQVVDLKVDSVSTNDSIVANDSVGASVNSESVVDSITNAGKEKTLSKEASADAISQPERPKTHVMKPGDSLTKISKRYYGTKDSVNAIIKANAFADPNNVPIGAKVVLP